ncbi:hypothetical protein JTB14_033330 [Gonioctena quinquepunctata]|nr:hypothetical protein JTB14_033330 [Gonioctena quinquepunctata]
MSDICSVCDVAIARSGRNQPRISCLRCKKTLHLKYLQLPADLEKTMTLPGMVWYCTECSRKLDSDVRDSTTLQDILMKLSNIENDITALKKSHSDIIQSVQFYGDKIDVFATKIQEFEKTIISVKYAKQQIDNNTLNITNLAEEIEKIQQYLRMNNSEISGMPEEKKRT